MHPVKKTTECYKNVEPKKKVKTKEYLVEQVAELGRDKFASDQQ